MKHVTLHLITGSVTAAVVVAGAVEYVVDIAAVRPLSCQTAAGAYRILWPEAASPPVPSPPRARGAVGAAVGTPVPYAAGPPARGSVSPAAGSLWAPCGRAGPPRHLEQRVRAQRSRQRWRGLGSAGRPRPATRCPRRPPI